MACATNLLWGPGAALTRFTGERNSDTGALTTRRFSELDSDIEIVNDPMDRMDDLSNQPINDPEGYSGLPED